jgi:hypothetical protein
MVYAMLMFATAGIGFGGSPWVGFAIGASANVVLEMSRQRERLSRYRGYPKTDIVFSILSDLSLAIAGAFVCAWFGYYLALLFKR